METPDPDVVWIDERLDWASIGPTLLIVPDWIRWHCSVPDGFAKGEPYEMIDYQLWCTLNHYRVRPTAVWRPSNPLRATAFVYRRSQVVGPQKALALDTPIATPAGWSTMGALRVGDSVFDRHGEPAVVLGKSQIWNCDTFRVTFSDNTSLVACGDHEWVVDLRSPSATYLPRRMSTAEILADGLVDAHGARKYRIENADPINLPEADLPIDPYVLGAWLGDGNSDDGRLTGLDREVFTRIELAGYEVRQMKVFKRVGVQGLKVQLRAVGVLCNKHIPPAYLRSSEKQRWALMQGLMDTDGYADERQGKCEFTTVLPALRDGFMELATTLGIRPTCYEGRSVLDGVDKGPKWRINFAARSDMPVFHLERKQSRLKPPGQSHSQFLHRRIIAIDPIDSVPTQCITVSSPSHTFLAGRQMIPTGNSGKGPWSATIVANEAVGPALFAGWAKGGEQYRCRDHGCGCGWVYTYGAGEPMGMPWPTPLIQLTAKSEDQIHDNVYEPLKEMIKNGPLADTMRVTEGFVALPNSGRIDVVTSSADSRLGQRVTCVLNDETGLYTKSNGLLRVAQTQARGAAGMGGRTLETTNCWDPSEGSRAQKTSESRRPDIFKFYREPNPAWNYLDEAERRLIHEYVYAGCHWVDLDGVDGEAAELIETDPNQAERFFGNRKKYGGGQWMPDELWAKAIAGGKERHAA